MKKLIKIIFIFVFILSHNISVYVYAGQVTMALCDFNGDGKDEIVKTNEADGKTFIRFYSQIENSYFFKPLKEFTVVGRLVQIPEIEDINKDGLKDYCYATGGDMGIIYYSLNNNDFIKTNNYDFDNNVNAENINNKRIEKKQILSDVEKHLNKMKEIEQNSMFTEDKVKNIIDTSDKVAEKKTIIKQNNENSDATATILNYDNINTI